MAVEHQLTTQVAVTHFDLGFQLMPGVPARVWTVRHAG
jgi:hypothetical protein